MAAGVSPQQCRTLLSRSVHMPAVQSGAVSSMNACAALTRCGPANTRSMLGGSGADVRRGCVGPRMFTATVCFRGDFWDYTALISSRQDLRFARWQ
jgi:hypothetical protein